LILFGGVEMSLAAGLLRRAAWKFSFPILAAFGTLFLVFHEHGGGAEHMHMEMDAASHTAVVYQHIIYIVLGLQAVAARVLYDTRRIDGPWARYLWPVLITCVGVALLLYRE
jgi:hypothetical protein